MIWEKEEKVLDAFIARKGLKNSRRRRDILRVFLSIEKHITLDELYRAVKEKHPEIGHATVYRA